MTTLYTDGFATFYERYNTGWTWAFAPALASHLASTHTTARSLLDLCCGTGVAIEVFAEAGWRVTGVDFSAGMLGIARGRLAPRIATGDVLLLEAAATEFAVPEPVGACICLDGALNHLASVAELERCFTLVRESLLDGGQFLFDLYEPTHFQHWHNIAMIDDGYAVVTKRGVWDDTRRQGMLRVSGLVGEGAECLRVEQSLWVRTFSAAEVETALTDAGLVRADPGIDTCKEGMRAEARYSDVPSRTLYRAIKPPHT